MAKGHENLIPANLRTKEELREITRKGGIKSGETRRRKKMMADIVKHQVYEMELPEVLARSLQEQGIDANEWNHANVMVRSMIARAESGDVSAYNTILAMLGEKPKEKVEMDASMCMKIEYVSSGHGVVNSEEEIEDES